MGLFNFNSQKPIEVPKPTPNSDIRKLETVLKAWLNSEQRKEQILAEDYYLGKQAILDKQRFVIGEDGNLTPVTNLPNNKIVDNVYAKLVNQKTNYCLGKPITLATAKEDYLELLYKIFNKKLHRNLRVLAKHAVNEGIAYLYPYYNENQEFKVAVFQAHEICPIWKDKAHTELESVMRYYPEEVFDDNGGIKLIYHVDLFTTNGITHFEFKGGTLVAANPVHTDYIYKESVGYNWKRLPIIPFKYNADETPLIRRVKSIQDAINETISGFKDNMDEDPRTSILVLKNYDGTNIPEFRRNLATYGIVKVTTVDGVQGGLDVLKVDVNAQNYQLNMMQLKRSMIENGYGFDAKEERMDGDPNQMNIESMYTDIDLDVNAMESEFQAGFEELKWFIDAYLKEFGNPDYSEEEVEFIFNRDIFINEDAKIDNCVKSVGIVSNKTILSRHPWVTNVEHEMKEIENDKKADLEEMEATQQVMNANKPTTTNGKSGSGEGNKE